jgi:hypothetical protein
MPSRKPTTSAVAFPDIEQGLPHDQDASRSTVGADNSQTVTPESQRSLEDVPRQQSYLAAKWTRLRDRLPAPVVHYTGKAVGWIKGPQPPRIYTINPLFESFQTFPLRLFARIPKAGRLAVLFLAFIIWVVVFGVIISKRGLPTDMAGLGTPVRLACASRLW